MTDTERDAMYLEIHDHDVSLRLAFLAAHEADPKRPWKEIEDQITEDFRDRYLKILEKYNGSPIFRTIQPAPLIHL